MSGSCLCLRPVVISYATTLHLRENRYLHVSAFCTARKGLGTSLGKRYATGTGDKLVHSFRHSFIHPHPIENCALPVHKQYPDRLRSSVVFWLIRSLVDPTLAAFIIWGPLQLSHTIIRQRRADTLCKNLWHSPVT